jgi:hypothetical protein
VSPRIFRARIKTIPNFQLSTLNSFAGEWRIENWE